MPQGVGHDGDATRAIATNEPHDGERHEGKPGQRKQGSCHEDNGVSALRYNFVDHPSVPIFFYARFHCKTLRDRVMRGLGYGSRIERSVVSSRLT